MCNLCSLLRCVVISNFTAATAARKTSVNLIEKLEMQFKWKIRKAAMGKNFPPNERSKMLFDELRARMLLPIMAGLQDEIGNGKQWKIIEGISDCFITDKLGFI